MIKKIVSKIIKIKKLSPSVHDFTISFQNEKLDFNSGQFINLIFKSEGIRYIKPYSIASSPKDNKKINLCIKLIKTGYATPHLWNLKENDELEIHGPFGLFGTKINYNKEEMVFIGTGSGISPLRSMILDFLEKKIEKKIILIFGNRYEEEILYKKEFEDMEIKNKNFKFIQVISKPNPNWEGEKGHVQDNFNEINFSKSQFFICGIKNMVSDVKKELLKNNVQEENIILEKY